MRRLSWLREIQRLVSLYAVAALCFIPAGIVLSVLSAFGRASIFVAAALMGASALLAMLTWSVFEKRWATNEGKRKPDMSADSAGALVFGYPAASQVQLVAAAFLFFVMVPVTSQRATVRTMIESSDTTDGNLLVVRA